MTTYPKSEFSPNVTSPQGPDVGGNVYLLRTETQKHPVLLAREECDMAALAALKFRRQAETAERELAAMKERHKAEIDDQKRRIANFREFAAEQDVIATGYYADRPVMVELRANSRTSTVHYVRTDTGQEVDTRALSPDETQSVLPLATVDITDKQLAEIACYLPATADEIAAIEGSPLSPAQVVAILKAGSSRGYFTNNGSMYELSMAGSNWFFPEVDEPLPEVDFSSPEECLADIDVDGLDIPPPVLVVALRDLAPVMQNLFAAGGSSTVRRVAHSLGDAWTVDRVRNAMNNAIEAGFVTGTGGDRAKRMLTQVGYEQLREWAKS